MTADANTPRCGVEGYGLTCDREVGHEGQHRGYSEAFDAPMFWARDEDLVCKHGVAMDVHCCGCHSGFLFDAATCVCGVNQRRRKYVRR